MQIKKEFETDLIWRRQKKDVQVDLEILIGRIYEKVLDRGL